MKNSHTIFIAFICTLSYSQDTIKYWFDTYFYEPDSMEITSLQYECVNQLAKSDLKNRVEKAKDDSYAGEGIFQGVKIPPPSWPIDKLFKQPLF